MVDAVALLPAASVAVNVTVAVPRGKMAGALLDTGTDPLQLFVAVGTPRDSSARRRSEQEDSRTLALSYPAPRSSPYPSPFLRARHYGQENRPCSGFTVGKSAEAVIPAMTQLPSVPMAVAVPPSKSLPPRYVV